MNANLVSIYVGVAACAAFLLFSYFVCNKVPTFSQVAAVLLAWAGAVVGAYLGYFVLTADDPTLGKLADQRLAILLGAMAVVWIAAESFFTSLKSVRA